LRLALGAQQLEQVPGVRLGGLIAEERLRRGRVQRAEHREATELIEEHSKIALGERFLAAGNLQRRLHQEQRFLRRDERGTARTSAFLTLFGSARGARLRFLARSLRRLLAAIFEQLIELGRERCMLPATPVLGCAERVEDVAVAPGGVLLSLQRSPRVLQHLVETLDGRSGADSKLQRRNVLPQPARTEQLDRILDLVHHALGNQWTVDASPRQRSREMRPEGLRWQGHVDASLLFRIAAMPIRAVIVDQATVAIAQLDVDLFAFAARDIRATAAQVEVIPTVAIRERDGDRVL
jgi:hypothetical protein